MKEVPARLRLRLMTGPALALMLCIGAISGCADLQPRSFGPCGAVGAGAGALLGGAGGAGIVYGFSSHPGTTEYGSAAGGGALIGAVLGFGVGHYLCDPIVQPPPSPAPAPAATPAPPPPPPAAAVPTNEKIVLRGVHFDFNKSDIRPEDEPVLDEGIDVLKQHPSVAVNVNGYCDAIGGDAYNLRLSQRRSAAVVGYLGGHGIAESRLSAHGYGKTNFVAPNDTAEGRAQNRRVEIVPVE
jgi:outer membrane protein OmpA-like peptidoglycan-associated protein